MSSAQPGSMPDTNTELSPLAQARSMASIDRRRARSPGGATDRTTSTPRWRPTPGTRRDRRTRRRAGCRRWRCTRPHPRRPSYATLVSSVASTPSGSMNASSPASRPTFAGFDTTTPTSSRSACAATARIAGRPAFPVPHTTTRYAMGGGAYGRGASTRGSPPTTGTTSWRPPGCGASGASSTRSRRCSRGSRGSCRTAPRPTGCPSAPRCRRDGAARSPASRRSPSVRDRGSRSRPSAEVTPARRARNPSPRRLRAMRVPTAPVVAGSLIGGYYVARKTHIRPLGGAVLTRRRLHRRAGVARSTRDR